VTTIDPGEAVQTPAGTGPLGSPEGTGRTYAAIGLVADAGAPDAVVDGGTQGTDDGSGTR
jgi:hypothetical protein